MKLQHLGKTVEMDARQATVENRIVLMLNRHRDGVRQTRLSSLTGSGRFGYDLFKQAIERLVNEDVIARIPTTHEQAFLLKLTPYGEQRAEQLARESEQLREKQKATATV